MRTTRQSCLDSRNTGARGRDCSKRAVGACNKYDDRKRMSSVTTKLIWHPSNTTDIISMVFDVFILRHSLNHMGKLIMNYKCCRVENINVY